jgi:hypothetical protein
METAIAQHTNCDMRPCPRLLNYEKSEEDDDLCRRAGLKQGNGETLEGGMSAE